MQRVTVSGVTRGVVACIGDVERPQRYSSSDDVSQLTLCSGRCESVCAPNSLVMD